MVSIIFLSSIEWLPWLSVVLRMVYGVVKTVFRVVYMALWSDLDRSRGSKHGCTRKAFEVVSMTTKLLAWLCEVVRKVFMGC